MTKAEALHIFTTALVRELLREDSPGILPDFAAGPPPPNPSAPQPQFDFDESVCMHGGVAIERASCPIHGPSAEYTPTAEELDDITSEELPEPLQRAKRLAEQREKREKRGPLFAEDLPMSGLGPPAE